MDKELMHKAVALGINASMYYLLPACRREDLLRRDVQRAEDRLKKLSAPDDK